MAKQFEFLVDDTTLAIIIDTFLKAFENPVIVSQNYNLEYKKISNNNSLSFDNLENYGTNFFHGNEGYHMVLITDEKYLNEIIFIYNKFLGYKIIDIFNSPVLEFSPCKLNEKGKIRISGRVASFYNKEKKHEILAAYSKIVRALRKICK